MSCFREVSPKSKPFKKFYLAFMLWFVGRAIAATAKTDKEMKKEFSDLLENFTFSLGVAPNGHHMVVGKNDKGTVKYIGSKLYDKKNHAKDIDVKMTIKSLEAAFLLFTFQESTSVSNARDRLIVDGGIPETCAVVRIMDMVEEYIFFLNLSQNLL